MSAMKENTGPVKREDLAKTIGTSFYYSSWSQLTAMAKGECLRAADAVLAALAVQDPGREEPQPPPLEEDAQTALMYLETGFLKCEKCSHESETKNLDAAYTLRRALSAPQPQDPWRDIGTAPKDGTKVDIWARDERRTDVYWSDLQGWWCVDGAYGPEEPTPLAASPRPTHWMPTPSAPKEDVK